LLASSAIGWLTRAGRFVQQIQCWGGAGVFSALRNSGANYKAHLYVDEGSRRTPSLRSPAGSRTSPSKRILVRTEGRKPLGAKGVRTGYATARLASGGAAPPVQRISTASSTDEMLKTQVRRVRPSISRTKLDGLTSLS